MALIPATSLIMTVYNRERFLAEAIGSVLTQTSPDFELVIWDDGSDDSSLATARRFARFDKRVRVMAADHRGRASALKAAHAEAVGRYVGWVDSDDLLTPTALSDTLQVLEDHPTAGFVYTDYLVVDEAGGVRGIGNRCRIPYSRDRLLVDFMTFHFRLIRREAFERAGGIDPSFECAVDYDLCLRLSEVADVLHLAKPLYKYRVHRESISGRKRVKQMLCSQEAISKALERRGIARDFKVEVDFVSGSFQLVRRNRREAFDIGKAR